MISIDMDPQRVQAVLKGHRRFADPFGEPPGYSIVSEKGNAVPPAAEALFWDRLKYAAEHTDALIQAAFRPEYFDFYGMDRTLARTPGEMCRGLIFDSFVLYAEDAGVGACLANGDFLFGHFIECRWDRAWDLVFSWIC